VLVNFFATWCVPCRIEHPDLVAFHQRHRAIGDAEVLGVVYSDSTDAVRQFRSEYGGDWPMLVDPNGRIALELGVAGVPESFLISPDGIVVSKIVGGVRGSDLDDLLTRAQAQRPQRQRRTS
jgi:cytochrome c biogenesis protein CcmG/thiol:disulfide interchange protein DsbE